MREDIKRMNIANTINLTVVIIGIGVGFLGEVGLVNLGLFLIASTTNAVIIEKTKNIFKKIDQEGEFQNV